MKIINGIPQSAWVVAVDRYEEMGIQTVVVRKGRAKSGKGDDFALRFATEKDALDFYKTHSEFQEFNEECSKNLSLIN